MENGLITTEIDRLTTEILILKAQTAQNIIEIGKRLITVKESLPHGEWGKWLAEKVDFSERTARRFMQAANEFSKRPALTGLSPTKVFALLDLPADECEQFVQEPHKLPTGETKTVDEMTTRELQQVIKERDEALKQLEEFKCVYDETAIETRKLLEEKQKAESSARTAQEDVKTLQSALEEERKQSKENIAKIQEVMSKLEQQLSEAQASGNNAEVERLSESLLKTDNELTDALEVIKELERQLKEKPIEAPTATVIKIPDEVQQELDELREKASQQVNTAALKFKVYFDELVKGFQSLLGALGEIADPVEKDQYEKAVLGLIGKMSERL